MSEVSKADQLKALREHLATAKKHGDKAEQVQLELQIKALG